MHTLSQKFTTTSDVRNLAFKLFGENTPIADKELNATNISGATYSILNEWFQRQQGPAKAYKYLCQSLREIHLNLLAEDLKGIVEDEITKSDLGKTFPKSMALSLTTFSKKTYICCCYI